MKKFIFEKEETVFINGKRTNIYSVYQMGQEEISEEIEELQGLNSKFIKREASSNCKIFVGRVKGRNMEEAKENFLQF